MFDLQVPPYELMIRSAAVYLFLLAGLRLTGKREIGQMTPFDLVVILVISNAVQNAMVGTDTSLIGGLIAAATLLVVNLGIALARDRSPFIRQAVEGNATLLINDGRFLTANLRRERLSEDEVRMVMREHGITDLEQVRMAVLEVDGSISIVPSDAGTIHTRKHFRQLKSKG